MLYRFLTSKRVFPGKSTPGFGFFLRNCKVFHRPLTKTRHTFKTITLVGFVTRVVAVPHESSPSGIESGVRSVHW